MLKVQFPLFFQKIWHLTAILFSCFYDIFIVAHICLSIWQQLFQNDQNKDKVKWKYFYTLHCIVTKSYASQAHSFTLLLVLVLTVFPDHPPVVQYVSSHLMSWPDVTGVRGSDVLGETTLTLLVTSLTSCRPAQCGPSYNGLVSTLAVAWPGLTQLSLLG